MAAESDEHTTAGPTRARLLEATLEVFLEKGYAGTRVQEIAARAGYTTGAIYANFTGKADLLTAAIAGAGAEAVTRAFEPEPEEVEASVADVLTRRGADLLSGAGSPRSVLLLDAFAAAARDPGRHGDVRAQVEWLRGLQGALVERGRNEGDVDGGLDAEAVVAVVEAITLGAIVARALGLARPDRAAVEEVLRRIVASVRPTGD